MVNLDDIKREAKKVLEGKKVKYIIGFTKGPNRLSSVPAFIKEPTDVDRLIWDSTCVLNLTRFLVDEKRNTNRESDEKPVGIIVKGCDSRAINVLLQEKFIKREDIFIIGVSCEESGVIDFEKLKSQTKNKSVEKIEKNEKNSFVVFTEEGQIPIPVNELLAERCLECKYNFPVIYDIFIGDKVKRDQKTPFQSLQKIENLSPEERWKFWKNQFDKCIRCYACRSVCPMCYCEECVADTINFAVTADTTAEEKAQKIRWTEKSPVTSENFIYHLIRAIHLAGRCIDCGECERVCPLDIPLRFLNRKLEKEAHELFAYESGLSSDHPSLIACFKDEDPQDFIR